MEFLVFFIVYSTEDTDESVFYYDPIILIFAMFFRKPTKKWILIIFLHILVGVLSGVFLKILYSCTSNTKFYSKSEEEERNLITNSTPSAFVYRPNQFVSSYEISVTNVFSQTIHIFVFFWFQNVNSSHVFISPLSIALCDWLLLSFTTSQVFFFSSALSTSILTNEWSPLIVVLSSDAIGVFIFSIFVFFDNLLDLSIFSNQDSAEQEEHEETFSTQHYTTEKPQIQLSLPTNNALFFGKRNVEIGVKCDDIVNKIREFRI